VCSSRYYLSPNSSPRRVAYSVAISPVFSDLSVGLHLSQRNGRLSLLLFVGFSRCSSLIVSSRIPNWEFDNPDVVLHRKLDDAERYYRLEH
jgi:hypothetical protein